MSARIAELDWRETAMGEISLRRRREPALDVDVYEVKLGDEFLMSSLFTVAEVALADLGLAATTATDLDVVVGGLGLGWTARAALADPRVRSLRVIEALEAVVDWHRQGLLPHAEELTGERRCSLVLGDFFASVATGEGFGGGPALCHAVLLDVDHTPDQVLHPSHTAFYTAEGLTRLRAMLHPGGVFALWSDAPPEERFLAVARSVFSVVEAHVVAFPNPLTGSESANTVYVATHRPPD